MQGIYLINLRNFFRSKRYRIGFVIPDWIKPYHKVMASTRIRVYDVIKYFDNDKDYLLELRNPLRKYDAVFFQKAFDEKALKLAKKLRSTKAKVLLDVNVNYYDRASKYVSSKQYRDIYAFTENADAVVATTAYIGNHVRALFPMKKVFVIEESIDGSYFKFSKEHFAQGRSLVWVGYADKASELLMISDVLTQLHSETLFRLILICEKDPKINIDGIPISYLRYNQAKIAQQLMLGDIFIAPRDLSDTYNLSHSFTKIGTAMAVGLPVIASAVPSYLNSPAVICRNKSEWSRSLSAMFEDDVYLRHLSIRGKEYVRSNYTMERIQRKYRMLYRYLVA